MIPRSAAVCKLSMPWGAERRRATVSREPLCRHGSQLGLLQLRRPMSRRRAARQWSRRNKYHLLTLKLLLDETTWNPLASAPAGVEAFFRDREDARDRPVLVPGKGCVVLQS